MPRHRPQEPKGRKDSRLRRAELVPQFDLARARSWEVKTARDVFRLPAKGQESADVWCVVGRRGQSFERRQWTYCVTSCLSQWIAKEYKRALSSATEHPGTMRWERRCCRALTSRRCGNLC